MVQTTNETSALQSTLADRLKEGGMWTWAYVDASGNREDPQHLAALQRRKAEDALRAAGADADVIDTVMAELEETPGVAAPVSRYVLVRDGELVLSEVLPGRMHAAQSIGHDPVPDLLPLLAHRPMDVPFLVVQVGREGGGYRAFHLGHADHPDRRDEDRVQGRTDTLHKVKGGGWAHLRWQHHTEEIWKQTSAEVAASIEEAVRRLSPRLIVVAGDIRARELLLKELSTEARSLVSEVPIDPRADDAADAALVEHVEIALARVLASRRHDVEDLLRTHVGRGDNQTVSGLGSVVGALQQAQASVVALDHQALGDRQLLALAAAPWVATAPEQASGVAVLGTVPAACALVRAIALTDAELILVNAASLPGGAVAAALLRWPVGPPVPA
ncbi:Vms1/Ankzf1 family peptidyl-tRNA hydrolase [Curtobacterium sp. MCPF17_002]|uniref:baeRF2 domain-containing protein n=1 Tax=Curtobacterium sp. MCPF17_002 TaxID=2175645 RepID=UPI000DA824CE|nr:Vms1/Ankzf1 family peptidyl-tRNA hydrolase [Curtobacterium sp. MCPF17_002]WIB78019.1 Vms1/Ankzf1 family peptidyl-tRNA hydrolase [Curtobacterium sp. MCPF17_002]